jgi:hypothetical protein
MAIQLISLVSFGLVIALLPLRVVPLVVRLAFVFAVGIIILPATSSGMTIDDLVQQLLGQRSSFLTREPLPMMSVCLAATSGALFAVLVSVGAFTVYCFSHWSSVLVFGKEWSDRDILVTQESSGTDALQVLFSLLFVSLLVLVVGVERIAEFFGLGLLLFMQLPEFGADLDSTWGLARAGSLLVIDAGRIALLSGLIIGLPLFITSLIVDFVCLVASRYFSDGTWSHALRIPILTLALLLILPQVAAQVVSVTRDTLDRDAVRHFGSTIVELKQSPVSLSRAGEEIRR